MLLKTLELQGYKTFAEQTLFELADHITCIVGPNGSGKSNIADAIRWVLGEQAYSILRGKKTVDMIFHGSEERARAGMASVEIVFDNTSGWLPVDFSEVSIGRRAYRDGTNEYLLNGQKVRLLDIRELLGNSGLSERTYTVIGQGLVDSALSLRADERRSLFEEAAGIGLYRSRREEAQRRLEKTRRNLERIEDILSELRPRLRSLERQSRRAEQYEYVKADLQVLLRDWYGYHWHRAQRELNQARQTARQQNVALNQTRDQQKKLDQALTDFRTRIQGVRARLSSWHGEMSQLHARREKITRQLAVADERARSLVRQRQDSADELARLEQRIEAHRERLSEADAEVRRLQVDLEQARRQVEEAQAALAARQAERQAVEEAIAQGQEQIASLSSRKVELQARLQERQAQIERSRLDLGEIEAAVEQADQALRRVNDQRKQAQQAFQKATSARQQAEEELERHRQRIEEVEAERKRKIDRRDGLQTELARLQAQLDVLEQAEKALAGYAQGTQLLLKAAQSGKLQGAQGALSSRLRVPQELEAAIAAALGEYLDAVLLEQGGSSGAALELLRADATRGTLLPLDDLIPLEPLKVEQRDGVLGVASSLIQVSPQLRPAVDLLLGHTLVTQDAAAAYQALKGQPHLVRAVTLRGEVFRADGPIVAGLGGEAATLSRPRQRRQIETKIAQKVRKGDDLAGEIAQLDDALTRLRTEEDDLARALKQLQQREERAAQTRREASLEHERVERQAQWQRERLQGLQAEIEAAQKESAQIESRSSRLETEIAQAQETLREGQSQLKNLSIQSYQLDVNHWSTQVAVAEQALGDAQARQRERQSAFDEAEQSRHDLQGRVRSLEGQIQRLEQEKVDLKSQEDEVAEAIDELQALIAPAEQEVEGADEEQDDLQRAEAEARKQLSIVDRRASQAQLNLTRSQEALDHLRERIESDFGLVAFDYDEDVSGPKPLPLGGMVKRLPVLEELPEGMEKTIKEKRAQLRRIGAVNPEAQKEYDEVHERYEFMTAQIEDLNEAEADIKAVIAELDALMERKFRHTFDAVAKEFRQIFTRLFGGGSARLLLTDPNDLTESGIDIDARLPGRRAQGLSLLSGGERSLTATALVFALLRVSPTPFCVLDEVDAMLDESNVARFRELLRELSQKTQFIVITHNRNTVQAADVIYGITMGRDLTSQVISLKMDEIADVIR